MDVIKILSNPVRSQIVQYLTIHGDSTTKQIAEAIPNTPQPTLYRHINALIKENVILIKEERKVRGSLERLLALDPKAFSVKENSLTDLSYQFLMSLFMRFSEYDKCAENDPLKDMLMLRQFNFHLSDEKYSELIREMAAVYKKYENVNDGKLRTLCLISAPAKEDNHE